MPQHLSLSFPHIWPNWLAIVRSFCSGGDFCKLNFDQVWFSCSTSCKLHSCPSPLPHHHLPSTLVETLQLSWSRLQVQIWGSALHKKANKDKCQMYRSLYGIIRRADLNCQMSLCNMIRTQVSVQAIEVCKNKCVSCQAITRQRTSDTVQMYVGQQFERQLVQVCTGIGKPWAGQVKPETGTASQLWLMSPPQ